MSEKIKAGDFVRNNRSGYVFEVARQHHYRPWAWQIKHVGSKYAKWLDVETVFTDGKTRNSGYNKIPAPPES